MEHLGPSLEDLLQKYKRFSLRTTLLLADQILGIIEDMHAQSIAHRDIKPDNFLLGPAPNPRQAKIYIVDFGLARRFRDAERRHIPYREDRRLTGTA